MSSSIHATALVDPAAELEPDVRVGAYAVIGAGVQIGSGSTVGAHAVIEGPTRLGKENQVFQFASVGAAPQDRKYMGEPTRLELGDRNIIREFVTLNRGTAKSEGVTRVGSDNLFMSYAHVAHDCRIGDNCVLANAATLAGHVELGDWVIMAGLSGIHQFCKVGAHAFIGNNAAVTRDVPPYVMAVGQPAVAHSVNAEGLKRRGFSREQIRNLRGAFRILYRSGLKLTEARDQLSELAAEQPEIQPIIDFLAQSTRSIVR
jgi:UDP-N-acetylglucosamine acyltransferase